MTETAYFHRVFVILQPKYKPYTTMKISKTTFILALALLAMASCKKDLYDKDLYNGLVASQFMIDNADPDHDWRLTKHSSIFVKSLDENIRSIQILTENPYTSASAEIVAESIVFGTADELSYTVSVLTNELYVVAYDVYGNDLGYVKFAYDALSLDLSLSSLTKPGTINKPSYQTYTYLYESNFPMPDDFDYNDMVLRISKKKPEIGNSYVIDLTVTLEACGAGELYAGAIQLDGIRKDDIESVEIVGGKAMDDGYPTSPTFITDNSTLQQGRNGFAVIRLFECAQWAISKQQDNVGDIAVIRYNTERIDKENYSAKVSPVTTTYRITFKNSDTANSFTLDDVDPFLIHEYNTGFFEVHTYDHKFDLCISPINTNMRDYDNNVSWSVVIPKGDFRYPIEGAPLCIYKEDFDEYYGPYEGFAKWIKDCDTNHDWYLKLTDPELAY